MAAIFRTISADCTRLPMATPRQLTAVSASSAAMPSAGSGEASPMQPSRVAREGQATAAIPPVCTTSRRTQPYRNAASGW